MGSWEGGLAEGRRAKPTTDEAGGGAGKNVHRSGNQISGERITDPGPGFGFWIDCLRGGQEKKSAPSVLGVLPGQPNGISTADDKNSFLHAGGLGARFLRWGKFFLGGANTTEGALTAEWIFWKADESSELHECLIMSAWISLWNQGAGDFF